MVTQSLEYTLMSNHLQDDKGYMARVINQKTMDYTELLKEMEETTTCGKLPWKIPSPSHEGSALYPPRGGSSRPPFFSW